MEGRPNAAQHVPGRERVVRQPSASSLHAGVGGASPQYWRPCSSRPSRASRGNRQAVVVGG